MGRFWGSSQVLAYATSLVLAAGLLHACDLNPQPAPPAKEQGNASGGPAATSTTDSGTTGGIHVTTTTAGEPVVNGSATTGDTGIEDPDDGVDSESPPSSTSTSGATSGATTSAGGGLTGASGAGGAAGAPGDAEADGALPSVPTNRPR